MPTDPESNCAAVTDPPPTPGPGPKRARKSRAKPPACLSAAGVDPPPCLVASVPAKGEKGKTRQMRPKNANTSAPKPAKPTPAKPTAGPDPLTDQWRKLDADDRANLLGADYFEHEKPDRVRRLPPGEGFMPTASPDAWADLVAAGLVLVANAEAGQVEKPNTHRVDLTRHGRRLAAHALANRLPGTSEWRR